MIHGSWFRVLASTLMLGILGINAFLMRENSQLRERLELLTDHVDIHPGDTFPSFSGFDLSGQWTQVDFQDAGKKHLLILVSSTCPACLSSIDGWLELTSSIDTGQWNVLWLSRDPWEVTREFAQARGLTGQVLSEFSAREYRSMGLRLVPRTIIVGPGGVVENIWVGQLDEERVADLSTHLLPDLRFAQSSF